MKKILIMACATFFSAQLMAQSASESAAASKTTSPVTLSQETPSAIKGTPIPEEKATPAAKTKTVTKKEEAINKTKQPVLVNSDNVPVPIPVKPVEN